MTTNTNHVRRAAKNGTSTAEKSQKEGRIVPKKQGNNNHKHTVGLLYKHDYCILACVDDLVEHICSTMDYNNSLMHDPNYGDINWMLRPVYTMKNYADRRYSTNLHRFEHCPDCGAKIDWKVIGNMDITTK